MESSRREEDGHCSGKLALINLIVSFVGNGCKNLTFFFTYLMLEDLKYILTAVTSDITNRNAHLHIELAYPCKQRSTIQPVQLLTLSLTD